MCEHPTTLSCQPRFPTVLIVAMIGRGGEGACRHVELVERGLDGVEVFLQLGGALWASEGQSAAQRADRVQQLAKDRGQLCRVLAPRVLHGQRRHTHQPPDHLEGQESGGRGGQLLISASCSELFVNSNSAVHGPGHIIFDS